MAGFEGGEDFWPVAGRTCQEIDGVHENQHKLNHLHLGQVLFPPQDLLSSQCCQCVINVPIEHHQVQKKSKRKVKVRAGVKLNERRSRQKKTGSLVPSSSKRQPHFFVAVAAD